jgi:hypothetical protein
MIEGVVDLWPSELAVPDAENAPVTILRQQAAILRARTANIVQGEVATAAEVRYAARDKTARGTVDRLSTVLSGFDPNDVEIPTGGVVHSFYLRVPTLSNYRYRLLTATHSEEAYPVTVSYEDERTECTNEKEFMDRLKQIFGNKRTLRIIQTLQAQATTDQK